MRPSLARYATALLIAGVAGAVRFAIAPWLDQQLPFITFFPAVAVAVVFAGLGPAIVVSLIGLAASNYLFLDARLTLDLANPGAMTAHVVYVLACTLIIATGVVAARRQARTASSLKTVLQSEAHFRLVADSAPMLIWASDKDNRRTYFNRRWLEFTGRTLEQELGDGWLDSVHPDDRGTLEGHEAVSAASAALGTPFRLRSARGEYRWMLDSGAPIFDSAGVLRGVIGSCVDITDRKQADESRAWLAAVVSASSDAIVSKTLDGIILSWNQSAERVFGYSAREAIGRSIDIIIPPELRDEETRILARLRRGELVEHFETTRLRKDGERIHIALTISPIRDDTGRIVGASKVARDITEHTRDVTELKRAEQALVDSEQRFVRFMQHLPGLAWIKDTQGRYVYANEAAAQAFNTPRERLTGKTDADLFDAETAGHFRDNDLRALDTPEGTQSMETLRHADGVVHHSIVSKFPIPGTDGRPTLIGGVAIDVTERKRAEEALYETARRKDEFLAVLGHELRNPLAPLSNGIALLKGWPTADPRVSRVLAMMDRQLVHLVRLVDDLLDVSRIGRGKAEIKLAPIDLRAVIGAAVEQAHPLMSERGHALTVRQADVPLAVNGDLERLLQVVVNLLGNAATYTEPGGRIDLSTEQVGEEAIIRVVDTGLGIAPEHLDTVFEPFAQVAEQSMQAGARGLGIGLALSREIVRMHGGRIEARSLGLGYGSEFRVSLPLAEQLAVPPDAEPAQDKEPPRSRRVLVVDDNVDAAESLQRLLQAYGHNVLAVSDGYAALKAVATFRPAIVLLDIGLPELDGYDVARRIRDMPGGRDIYLCAVTGWGQAEDKRRAREAGFDEHMTKPVDLAALSTLLAREGAA